MYIIIQLRDNNLRYRFSRDLIEIEILICNLKSYKNPEFYNISSFLI